MTEQELIDGWVHLLINFDPTWEYEERDDGVWLENKTGNIVTAPTLLAALQGALSLYGQNVGRPRLED